MLEKISADRVSTLSSGKADEASKKSRDRFYMPYLKQDAVYTLTRCGASL
jgi:hypothetical protein